MQGQGQVTMPEAIPPEGASWNQEGAFYGQEGAVL
jgi:hypothetical protein